MPMHDQRNFKRVNFRTEADIHIADKPYRCDLVDLALQGRYFAVTKALTCRSVIRPC